MSGGVLSRKSVVSNTEENPLYISDINKFLPPKDSDTVTALYPSNAVEVFQYRQGGIAGVILSTTTITYTSNSKNEILSVVVT